MYCPIDPAELAEKTSAVFDSSTKEYLILEFQLDDGKSELKFKRKTAEVEKFDRGSHELRNSKEDVLNLLGKIESVEDLRMNGFGEVNEEMLNALMKINFGTLTFTHSRVTSSFDALIHFLRMKKNKVVMKRDFMDPNFVTDEALSLLKKPIIIEAYCSYYETPTGLTDAYLANLNFGKGGVDKKIDIDYWNPRLTFGAIKKLAEETKARWGCYEIVENDFGLLDGKQIEEIVEYVRSQRAKNKKICTDGERGLWATEHKKTLFCINGKSTLKFTNFFENWRFKNGFSLPLDEIASVDMATLVDQNSVELFRNIKDVLFIEGDSIDEIPEAQYQFETVNFITALPAEHILFISADGKPHAPLKFLKNVVDEMEIEKTIAKFILMCSHIGFMAFGDVILTDNLYDLLRENAASTTIGEKWNMSDSLSSENRAALSENRSSGLFEKFQFTEEIPSLSDEEDSDSEMSNSSNESSLAESTQGDSDEDGSKKSDLDQISQNNNDVDDDIINSSDIDVDDDIDNLSDNGDSSSENTNVSENSSHEESSENESDEDNNYAKYNNGRVDYEFFYHEKI